MDTTKQLDAEGHGDKPNKRQREFTLLHACAEVSRDELLTALFAGRDNMAMALTWTLYELARHPDAVQDLRRIIEAIVGFN